MRWARRCDINFSPYPIVTCGPLFHDRVSADYNLITVMGYMDPAVEGATVIFLAALLSMSLLGLIPQYVWGIENGNQIPGRWNV